MNPTTKQIANMKLPMKPSNQRIYTSSRTRVLGRRVQGFSLIELMLALTLGLVVTAGIVQLFVGNNRTNELITGQSRLQESARYALDFISRSTRIGGFYGCDAEPDQLHTTLNANLEQVFELNMTIPVQGFDGTGAGNGVGDWTPSLAELPRNSSGGGGSINAIVPGNGIDISTLVPGTDILVVRYQLAPGWRVAQQVDELDNPVLIENTGDVPFEAGDYAVISDCEQATVFNITAVGGGGNVALTRGSGIGLFANSPTKDLSVRGISFGSDSAGSSQGSVVSQLLTDIYFVAESANLNNRGDNITSLWLKRGTDAPVEMVEGISDLQVLFGIDTITNDGRPSANRYVPYAGVGVNVIRSVRVSIEANTIDVVSESPEPISRTFTQTISLRNSEFEL